MQLKRRCDAWDCILDFHIDLFLLGEQFGIRIVHYATATVFFTYIYPHLFGKQFDVRTLHHPAANASLETATFFTNASWNSSGAQWVIEPDATIMAGRALV